MSEKLTFNDLKNIDSLLMDCEAVCNKSYEDKKELAGKLRFKIAKIMEEVVVEVKKK